MHLLLLLADKTRTGRRRVWNALVKNFLKLYFAGKLLYFNIAMGFEQDRLRRIRWQKCWECIALS
jgi:hypothetical protein